MRAGRALLAAARDPYRVLGMMPGATKRELRDRYLTLAKLLHPDSMPAGAPAGAFAELAAAYEQLATNPERAKRGVGMEEPWRRNWSEDDSEEDGELLMRLRRDYAGGRGGMAPHASPSSACVRSWKNGEPPCFVICAACKTVEKKEPP